MSDKVRYEVREGVAWLTLDDPPVNGYSYALMRELDARILDARFDPAVHVLVLTGAGERFFCAGADIRMLEQMEPEQKYAFCLHANETLLRLEHTPKLVIAALNGHTVGGGLEVALACDLRVGVRNTSQVGLPEVALGVLPGTGGTQRLARLLGPSRALEWMVEGRRVPMEEALSLGLLHRLLDPAGFLEAVHEYARSFTPPHRASLAVGAIKRAVRSGSDLALESGLALERELQARLFASGDARRGLEAYVRKESPAFEGR